MSAPSTTPKAKTAANATPQTEAHVETAPKASPKKRERVFSGIQPTGAPTLGNYLGAIKHWVAEQDVYENIFCVVDLHALTVPKDPAKLRQDTRQLAAVLFACGLDPKRSDVFIQSQLPAHAELAWLLDCVTPTGWLNRMTQFKSKAGDDRENATAGLYTYPVLMAADILIYKADAVPVGEDQKQHVELARDVANTFNHRYGPTFVEPRPLIREVGARIMSLEDPTRKMSKSDPEPSYISLLDPPNVVRKKIARATTDSERTIVFNAERPGIYNLLSIYQLLSGQTPEAIEAEFAGKGYKEFKAALADAVVAELEPIQRRYAEITSDPANLDALLAQGANKLRPLGDAMVREVKGKMGLVV